MAKNKLKVALAQISPVWLNRKKTTSKIIDYIKLASQKGSKLVVFGEAILPGYPFWLSFTDGAKFNSKIQKEIFAKYFEEAVQIRKGDLKPICKTAKKCKINVILGCIERAENRGSHSLYCSLVYINSSGKIKSVHRKLMPTYEERLVWAQGDGNGLRTHKLGKFTVGGLNCWENWLPLVRSTLYAQGEDLHVAIWPGGTHNTFDLTRFIAKESRSYVISVSGLMSKKDFTEEIPNLKKILKNSPKTLVNGGSCLAKPNGEWLIKPLKNKEKLLFAEIDHEIVREERQNFDPSGHYSRPDITQLTVNFERQSILKKIGKK
ncbi:MAG: carbon-nitrogen hydrolase family protein [Calditrichaeota bacterium]|nr:MAG: carbon-nitrogen hydrolase family protein [Calditrichota bacterium]